LKELDLSGNQLTEVPEAITRLVKLTQLYYRISEKSFVELIKIIETDT
jgi:Leucine-rich repeat (LRR) protein